MLRSGQTARYAVFVALLAAVTLAAAACGTAGSPAAVRSPSASVSSPSVRTAVASGSRGLAKRTSRRGRHVVARPRSQAEFIDAAKFSAVRLWAHLLNPRPHTVRKVITSRAALARLARSLNALHAGQELSYTCFPDDGDYLVTFLPATPSQPAITAAPNACNGVGVTAGGKPQPMLVGGLATIGLIKPLLGISKPKAL